MTDAFSDMAFIGTVIKHLSRNRVESEADRHCACMVLNSVNLK